MDAINKPPLLGVRCEGFCHFGKVIFHVKEIIKIAYLVIPYDGNYQIVSGVMYFFCLGKTLLILQDLRNLFCFD